MKSIADQFGMKKNGTNTAGGVGGGGGAAEPNVPMPRPTQPVPQAAPRSTYDLVVAELNYEKSENQKLRVELAASLAHVNELQHICDNERRRNGILQRYASRVQTRLEDILHLITQAQRESLDEAMLDEQTHKAVKEVETDVAAFAAEQMGQKFGANSRPAEGAPEA